MVLSNNQLFFFKLMKWILTSEIEKHNLILIFVTSTFFNLIQSVSVVCQLYVYVKHLCVPVGCSCGGGGAWERKKRKESKENVPVLKSSKV